MDGRKGELARIRMHVPPILAHETTVAGYISAKDNGQLTLEILRNYEIIPNMKKPPKVHGPFGGFTFKPFGWRSFMAVS